MATKKQLEAKLTDKQRRACLLLVEKELAPEANGNTYEDIADLVGVDDSTLYRWRKQNPDFIEYKNLIADEFFSDERAKVYAQLLKMIFGSQPSIKAIDLYMKRFGLLSEKQIVENIDSTGGTLDGDAIEAELAELEADLD